MNETASCSVATETLKEVKKISRWMLLKGILLVIIGIFALGHTGMLVAFSAVSVFLLGIFVTIGAIIQIMYSFSSKNTGRIILNILIGLLYLWIGITALFNPLKMSVFLTLMIAGVLLAVGIVRIIQAVQHKGVPGWGMLLVSGILSVLLSVIIFAQWPISGLWVIGMFIAIELLFNGLASITLSLAVRSAGDAAEEAAPAPPTPEPEA